MRVSVIIPTYHRPELLQETIESVWAQTELPFEIIIGDDSKNNDTEKLVTETLAKISPIPIRYFHHVPSLREVKNVDFQYEKAEGELILHLHDDDPIYPNCIKVLKEPFTNFPEIVASFGLQRMINEDGSKVEKDDLVNEVYFRTQGRVGIVDGYLAGATSMFPNNGFLIRKDVAIKLGYSDNGVAGKATDFYFGFRLGKLRQPMYFVNEFTAKCRIVAESQSRLGDSDNSYQAVKILIADIHDNPTSSELDEVKQTIKNKMPIAITTAIKKGERGLAFKWMFSKYYIGRLLTPRGIKRILQFIKSFIK
jgi:glycosyltransferase involved in cell wall biosynthesis